MPMCMCCSCQAFDASKVPHDPLSNLRPDSIPTTGWCLVSTITKNNACALQPAMHPVMVLQIATSFNTTYNPASPVCVSPHDMYTWDDGITLTSFLSLDHRCTHHTTFTCTCHVNFHTHVTLASFVLLHYFLHVLWHTQRLISYSFRDSSTMSRTAFQKSQTSPSSSSIHSVSREVRLLSR